jgi:predicted esterase
MSSLIRLLVAGLVSTGWLVGSANACAADAPASGIKLNGLPFEQRDIVDRLGRTVRYYISEPKTTPAPLLLMIQGSGCLPVLTIGPDRSFSTVFDFIPLAEQGRFAVMAVNKPFSGGEPSKHFGSARTCSASFNEDFTAERWLVALQAALDDALQSPLIDRSKILVIGHSEGAVMADFLAGSDSRITDVVALGGSGTSQLFDFVANAYRCFDVSKCLEEISANVRAINADPNNASALAWGHPYKRWSSFFKLDPGEELLRSKARIFIGFGTADKAVPALSEEVAISRLVAAGRDITVRRVPDAGHSLTDDANPNYDDLRKVYDSAIAWFWHHNE